MLLRRLGNKTLLLPKLLDLFPENITTFVDMFMGSGAVSFAMIDRAKYIIANDKDEEVFNLFMAMKEHREELEKAISLMPIHESLFNYWKKQPEHDCVWQATRFLMLSNFGIFGQSSTLRFGPGNDKQILLKGIEQLFETICNIQLMACDFRDVLNKIGVRDKRESHSFFIYADPPYISTCNNYQESFTAVDTQDLFDLLIGSGIRFAVSEFDNPFVIDLAQRYGLHINRIGERRTLNNRNTEILITNYDPTPRQTSLFHGQL